MRAAAVTWRRAAGRARAPHGSARTPAVAGRALSDKTVADMRLDHGGSGLTVKLPRHTIPCASVVALSQTSDGRRRSSTTGAESASADVTMEKTCGINTSGG